MLVEYYFPQSLSAARLDRYLAGGWFRSGPSLFRARLLCLEGSLYSVINIRVGLDGLKLSRSLRKISNRGKRAFRIEIGRAKIDPARERLYSQHKNRFKGFIFQSLEEFLFDGVSRYLFDTQEIAIYQEDDLVAVSYFDTGEMGVASLIGLYEEHLDRYSLGLFTMLQEMEYAQSIGARYYYPGYVLKGYEGFDYKLRLGNIQYYNWRGRWRPLDRVGEEEFVAERIKHAISRADYLLRVDQIQARKVIYPFFSVGYLGMVEEDFVRSATFLEIDAQREDVEVYLLEYIIEDEVYQLSSANTNQQYYVDFLDAEFSENFFSQDNQAPVVYVREELIYRSPHLERVIAQLRRILNTSSVQPKSSI